MWPAHINMVRHTLCRTVIINSWHNPVQQHLNPCFKPSMSKLVIRKQWHANNLFRHKYYCIRWKTSVKSVINEKEQGTSKDYYPGNKRAAVRYAAIAWSLSSWAAKALPVPIQAGANAPSKPVALLINKKIQTLVHNISLF